VKSMIVLITGTRKGIGHALANHFLQAETNIVVGCSRSSDEIIEHIRYQHYQVDVTVEIDVVKMVRDVISKHGRIDVLINNAGVAAMNHFLTTPYSTAKNIFDTNFHGSFLFSREVGKQMMRQKYGRIVNFSTVAVAHSLKGEAIYASSKSAIETMTRVSARELGSYGVTVNAIGPTPVETDLNKAVPQAKITELIELQAIPRLGTFEDVTNMIEFFVSEKSDFITGQIIYMGGVS
jgi:3-oxoacyl-[acyl-carrier protein] reductase